MHAAFFAERAGLQEAELVATVLGAGSEACWQPAERALIALVDELVDRRRISDATWADLAAHFDDAQLLEAIALVGFYHAISFLCNGLELPLESYAARFPKRL